MMSESNKQKRRLRKDNQTKSIEDFENLIGKSVMKITERPFKSTFKKNTVKGIVVHPNTGRPAFTFFEDDSYVECKVCKEV